MFRREGIPIMTAEMAQIMQKTRFFLLAGGILLSLAALRSEADWPVQFEIDASVRRPISPFIYGTNQPDFSRAEHIFTLTRWGGSRTTAYNWETNASNFGAEWQFQNTGVFSPNNAPADPVRQLIAASHAVDASVLVTVPILGFVAADRQADGDVGQTPDYLHRRFLVSLPRLGRHFDPQPDLFDNRVYQDEFVHYLETAFPECRRHSRRTIFYALDNEPDLWSQTHARLHPEKTRYDEIVRLNAEYAAAIKDTVPAALVFGPGNYGWQGYETLQDAPDAQGRNFIEFYLDAMRDVHQRTGRRLLDVLEVHWYPEAEANHARITGDDARSDAAAARIQAPRSLWDPNYVENSWITKNSTRGPIRLLPRLQERIDKHYRGTQLAISEYYFGGGGDISGALAQADVLGIFGREGVFAASVQPLGKTNNRFITAAFAMFRNYDGKGGSFGDLGLAAKTNDPARTSVYASLNMEGRVVVVALNKSNSSLLFEMLLKRAPSSTRAEVYCLSGIYPQPKRINDMLVDATGRLRGELPARSISTILLLPPVRQGNHSP